MHIQSDGTNTHQDLRIQAGKKETMRKSFTRHSYSLSRRGPTAGRLNRVVAQWKIEADARAKAEKEKKEGEK